MIAKYAATMLAAALMASAAGVWVSAVQPHRAKAEEQVALTCKVFLTQYPGNTKREAALPYLPLTDGGRRIHIARLDHSKSTWVTVKDGGTVTRTHVISSPPPSPPVFVTANVTVVGTPATSTVGVGANDHMRAATTTAGVAPSTSSATSTAPIRRVLRPMALPWGACRLNMANTPPG